MNYHGTDIPFPPEVQARFDRQRDRSYGTPYDRGSSDSYYRRGNGNPHKWVFPGTDGRGWDEITELTPDERAEYFQGFEDNEADFNFKDWG